MSPLIQDNRCHECKKLFCCSDCRDLHEKKKHPKPAVTTDCLLCRFQRLPLKQTADDDFICHLVIRHLPLQCVLCGQLYRTSSDLKNFQKCLYRHKKHNRKLSLVHKDSLEKLPVQATPSPITKNLSCPSNVDNDSPNELNFHSLQSLTSPPELIRQTSTPMHIGFAGERTEPLFKTPKVPTAFSLKTPTASFSGNKLSSILTPVNDQIDGEDTSSSQNLFYSATSQLITSQDSIGKSDSKRVLQNNFEPKSNMSGSDTPSRSMPLNYASTNGSSGYSREFFRSNSGRSLEVMEEQEEQGSIDMELTTPHGNPIELLEAPDPDPSIQAVECTKDLPKKVRFSDQHQIVADSTIDPTVSDSEEFYEAPEIPAEKSKNSESQLMIMKENEENSDKENLENQENSEDFRTPPSNNSSPTASRVVMMVVVENGYKISSSDLMPIINSSLKKLESVTTSEKVTSTITGVSSQLENGSSEIVRSVSSVDTYSTSSTLDYYSTPASNMALSMPRTQVNSPALFGRNASGIFSAMAQAMKYALSGLPGTGSSKSISPSREILHQRALDLNSVDSRRPSPSLSAIATSLLRRPGKRSRDSIYDGVQPSHHSAGFRSPRSDGGGPSSPVAKRPRSWHRIRGRDPIARMRRDESSESRITGISSETQHFQQGSLSVGDKILPLPSRAHQSTQTE